MAREEDVVSAIYSMIEIIVENKMHALRQGTWNYSESVDTNLSSVNIDNEEFRYIRKLAHVTGLVAGDPVLLARGPDLPLTIIGKIIGDITLAEPIA